MFNRELQLLSRIIRSGELDVVNRYGITAEDFNTPDGKAYYAYVLRYYQSPESKGSVIGVEHMGASPMFSGFTLCDDPNVTTEALCGEVRKERLYHEVDALTKLVAVTAEQDPREAIRLLQKRAADLQLLSSEKNATVQLSDVIEDIIGYYDMNKKGVDMSAGHWPWAPLDDVTRGIMPDDYIILYGRPKSGKSWILAYILAFLYLHGKRILLYTKEMTPLNLFMRVYACIAEIPYQGYRMGALSAVEEETMRQTAQLIRMLRDTSGQNIICLSGKDCPPGGDTVGWIRAHAEEKKPDIIGIDGMYLLSSSQKARTREEKISGISREVSQLRLDLQIPVIATFQATRGAAQHSRGELDEIAYSDALSQDTTCAIRVINDYKATGENTISLVVAGAREIPQFEGIRIRNKPAEDFGVEKILDSWDVNNAKESDSSDEQDNGPKKKKKAAKKKGPSEADAISKQFEHIL